MFFCFVYTVPATYFLTALVWINVTENLQYNNYVEVLPAKGLIKSRASGQWDFIPGSTPSRAVLCVSGTSGHLISGLSLPDWLYRNQLPYLRKQTIKKYLFLFLNIKNH